MATRQALRIEGESAAEIPHIRHTSLSRLLIVCSEHSPRRILQSEIKCHSHTQSLKFILLLRLSVLPVLPIE